MSHDQPHPDDERVSRLLADARHTEPLPPEVAARLDRTLEGLAEERRTPARSVAPVVDLAARRRRRLATGLVAAAAVVALGVSLPQVDLGGGSDSESAGSADTAASEREGGSVGREFASSEADSGGGADAGDPTTGEAAEPNAPMATPAEVRPESFKKDVAAARDLATDDAQAPPCGEPPAGAGQVVPVRYADREGYLVFGVTEGGRQEVTLYLCPGGELARRAVVPAP